MRIRNSRTKRGIVTIAGATAGVLALLSARHAIAASASWTGLGADSAWTTTGNWSTSPVPGTGDTATFNSAGNSKTTITTAPATLTSYLFDSVNCAAYTISASATTWSAPNNGGVSINSSVTTNQDLSGIQFIRPVSGTTIIFSNQGSGLLKLGTIFNSNTTNGNALIKFAPGSSATIEVASGKLLDNGSTAGRNCSVLQDDSGILKMAATGSFSGTDAEGNSLTIHRGTYQAATIGLTGAKTSIGGGGRVQFGQAGQTYTATLQYYSNADATTDRAFYIIDSNTAALDVTSTGKTLTFTSAITQSASTSGGGKLTKLGAGILKLSAANTYSGDTLISNGRIALGIATALQNSAYDTTGSTGAIGLDVTGFTTPTLGGLKGSVDLATAITGYSSVTGLTLNPQSGMTADYAGVIANGATGMTLTKTGSGTQILSGSNTFTGNVTISAGTLKLTNSNALGSGTKGLNMQGTSRSLQLSGGITIPAAVGYNLSSVSSDGGGVVSLDGANEIQGAINFTTGNGALNISSLSSSTLTVSGNLSMNQSARTFYLGGDSINANTFSGTISEGISGALSFQKQGTGKWILSNSATLTGATSVTNGTLLVNGSISSSSAVTVSGGKLGGTGVVGGAVTLTGGSISPGQSIESLGTGALSFGAASTFEYELNSLSLNGDLLASTGTLDIAAGATLTLTDLAAGTLPAGSKLTLISYHGGWAPGELFTYAGNTLANNAPITIGANQWIFKYDDTTGGANFPSDQSGATAFVTMTIIPEPSGLLMTSLSMGLLPLVRRRRA